MLQDWGIYEATKDRIVLAPPGVPVARLLGSGQADVGFQQLSELLGQAGIEIVGTLPETLQPLTAFAVGIAHDARHSEGARSLVDYLLSETARTAKTRHGMEPA